MRGFLDRRLIAPSLVALGALVLSACGAKNEALSDSAPADSPGASTTVASAPVTTVAEPLPVAPVGGVGFVDPQGKYTIDVSPDWEARPGVVLDTKELWFVAAPVDGFRPNLNILDQEAPLADLGTLMDASVEQLAAQYDVVDDWITTGTNGNELGFVEYTGTLESGGQKIEAHFLATMSLSKTTAVIATFASGESTFEDLYPTIESHLLTLRAS
ncbi:MAG: hypothetical protein AB7V43_05060 [Acidimicrobiia bacterium]